MKFYLEPHFRHPKKSNKTFCRLDVTIYLETSDEQINFSVTGTSKCHPDDTYDRNLGRRLAESRACQKAQKEIDKKLRILKSFADDLQSELWNGNRKLERIKHNEEVHYKSLIS